MSRYTVVSLREQKMSWHRFGWPIRIEDKSQSPPMRQIGCSWKNPLLNSVHLSEQLRRRDIPPLRFYFEVREEDRVVVISNVARLT